jgi:MerR family copper efflux transcriptional regulator
MTDGGLMTIGELSRRGGTPVKALRAYTDMGLIYSAGRSSAGCRLFDESALWCVAVIRELRALGLTVAEIRELAGIYLGRPGEPIGPHVADRLRTARGRVNARITGLRELRQRIDEALASNVPSASSSPTPPRPLSAPVPPPPRSWTSAPNTRLGWWWTDPAAAIIIAALAIRAGLETREHETGD